MTAIADARKTGAARTADAKLGATPAAKAPPRRARAKTPAAAASGMLAAPRDLLVPLERLVLGEANVRRVHRAEGLEELAALIDAQGLLQRLSVVAQEEGRFAVVAGGRRLRALQLLAERGRLSGDHPVECRLCDASQARQVSLAENSGREAMHPADQMVAFRELIEQERLSVAQVAQRFGVSALTVERRLRLARLAPRFLAMYREGGIDNDQLQALALIDDPAAQEAVWDGLRPHDRSAWRIRDVVTAEACSADSRLARFVGLDAYEAEGGAVRRDLFASDDDPGGVFLDDLPKLHALAMDRLRGIAAAVREEGWAWVECTLDTDRAAWRGYGFEEPSPRAPTDDEAAQLQRLAGELQACEQALDVHRDGADAEAEDFGEREEVLGDAVDAAQERLEAAREALRQWTPAQLGRAGALVRLDHRGDVAIERGLMRPVDREEPGAADARDGEATAGADSPARARSDIGERLMRDLGAHRTAALQAALVQSPRVALAALVHRMAETVFSLYGRGNDIVRVTTHVCGDGALAQAASGYADSPAAAVLSQAQGEWGDRLPGRMAAGPAAGGRAGPAGLLHGAQHRCDRPAGAAACGHERRARGSAARGHGRLVAADAAALPAAREQARHARRGARGNRGRAAGGVRGPQEAGACRALRRAARGDAVAAGAAAPAQPAGCVRGRLAR
jgi:ParB family chromosome partitioning protein